ncbi:hypothetical protein ESY86_13215 [Subsaximicrobium wynnwilliamsii]|uniref:Uncharacterized protein n=2 Tax=Subsaximicrobium wynnwilliamsii TaxID=291179 RepID=A0A5C6ZGC7_9FLAO|nr:hypothetical protein ESY87_10610 [Subsaximicrobium wynnwilliamsii]TXD88263.1 hypothetical protein ESY86_13215 [Subsaximicrobium wynnwilliamsii]TXE02984.1 hypothetical protein ESY88_09630 [Subsaximicrobium wynnwilliamsii]
MNKQIFSALVLFYFFFSTSSFAQTAADTTQTTKISKLFRSQRVVPIKMSYSRKEMKKETNDSSYITTNFEYQTSEGNWKSIGLQLRKRGNFRLKNCTFPPLKLKIKKDSAKGTIFKGNKRLKMVMPCSAQSGNNNKVVKEYMAYKFYEQLSPYHFKTRLLEIDYTDMKNKKPKNYKFMGFLIEDDKVVAKRYNGKVLNRNVHPLHQEVVCSVRHAFFQFMIGNTDYSAAYGHNVKLFFIDKNTVPVPYDFDMSGLVNARYAVVSQINNETLPMENVRQRLYRGFKQPNDVFQQVRQEYLGQKDAIYAIIEDCKPMFDDDSEYEKAKEYIQDFYQILINDAKFSKEIVKVARTK